MRTFSKAARSVSRCLLLSLSKRCSETNHKVTNANCLVSLGFLQRRYDLKMTAVECWKLLGVDKSALTAWEHGKHLPDHENGAKIVGFLGYGL